MNNLKKTIIAAKVMTIILMSMGIVVVYYANVSFLQKNICTGILGLIILILSASLVMEIE